MMETNFRTILSLRDEEFDEVIDQVIVAVLAAQDIMFDVLFAIIDVFENVKNKLLKAFVRSVRSKADIFANFKVAANTSGSPLGYFAFSGGE